MEAITTTSPSIEATQSGVVTSNTPSKHRKFWLFHLCSNSHNLIHSLTYDFLLQARSSLEGLGDVDKLFEDVSLTLQKCQTPTKSTSAITVLKPTQEQLQATINQLRELLKQPMNMILLDTGLVDQFVQMARFLIVNPSSLSESGRALLRLFVQNLDGTISSLQEAQEESSYKSKGGT